MATADHDPARVSRRLIRSTPDLRTEMISAMTRTDTPPAWDERTILTTFLDYTRATARHKCEGLSDADAAKALLPTSPLTTIGGLVNHVRWVEYSWIQSIFFGEEDEGPWTEEEPDREMSLGAQLPLAQVLAEYEAQCERYNQLLAGVDLDTRAERPFRNGEHPTLRWILMHLIEETARHNGHIDLLREMVDGVRGA